MRIRWGKFIDFSTGMLCINFVRPIFLRDLQVNVILWVFKVTAIKYLSLRSKIFRRVNFSYQT